VGKRKQDVAGRLRKRENRSGTTLQKRDERSKGYLSEEGSGEEEVVKRDVRSI